MLDAQQRELLVASVRKLTERFDHGYWHARSRAREGLDELWREMGRAGFLGVTTPEEYGGTGCSMSQLAIIIEEMAARGVPSLFMVVSTAMAATCIGRHGSDAHKRRYLPAMAEGREKFCFALTEPDAGSNSFAIRTLARRDGDGYVIRGQKVFISGADQADHMLLVARTAPLESVRDRREGMSLFAVDTSTPGIGLTAQDTGLTAPERQFQVFLDDVRVPDSCRIADEGAGLTALFDTLNPERIAAAAMAAGLGRFAIDRAAAYAREREVFGRPIGAYQGLSHPLALARVHVELGSLAAHRAAEAFDAGEQAGVWANMAKLAAADAALEAFDVAMQVHGGSGFEREVGLIDLWPMARLLKSAPVSREMILNHIAERVLGLPRSY